MDDELFIEADQARAALQALGLSGLSEDAGRAFLLGALLALVESAAWQDLDRSELPVAHEGYMSTLVALSGDDLQAAARVWVSVLNDRLNRTAVELNEATEGNGRMFVDVAGPAMLVAANLMALLNHSDLSEDRMRETIAMADGNLKMARRNLGQLRDTLRSQGFKLD